MASRDVVRGAGVEDPGGRGQSVYTLDLKPAIEIARLRPGRKAHDQCSCALSFYHISKSHVI